MRPTSEMRFVQKSSSTEIFDATAVEIYFYSVASHTPCGPTANCASASGKVGLSKTVQIRFSPRPFRKRRRVVDAWAIMFPPIGFVWSLAKLILSVNERSYNAHGHPCEGCSDNRYFQFSFETQLTGICNHLIRDKNSHTKFFR